MALFLHTKPHAALHSHESPDWYTPKPYVEAAREVMGGIDLDPMSDATANQTIKAVRYYTEQENGLNQVWKGRVFLNPSGRLVKEAWHKLLLSGEVEQAVWIGYSLEQLQTLQLWAKQTVTPLYFPICIPRRRIPFIENAAKRAARVQQCIKEGKTFKEKTSPSHANYITYIGPHQEKFFDAFQKFGHVRL